MKITLGLIGVFVLGYIVARFFPQPGALVGLP